MGHHNFFRKCTCGAIHRIRVESSQLDFIDELLEDIFCPKCHTSVCQLPEVDFNMQSQSPDFSINL